MELVRCLYHVDKLLNHEVLAVLQRGVVLNFIDVIVFFKALLSKDLLDSFLIHTFLNYSGLLRVFLFVFDGLTLANVDCKESCLAARPELTLIVLWNCECLDEGDPSIYRALNEVTEIAVHDKFEPKNDSPEKGFLVLFSAFFVKVMTFWVLLALAEPVLDFANQEVTPSVEHVCLKRGVEAELFGFHVFQLVWQLQDGFVGLDVPLVLELVNVLCAKDARHSAHVLIRTPVLMKDVVLFLQERVLRAADNAEVGIGALVKADWYTKLDETLMVIWVLHFFDDDALFHLPDVFLLNYAHEVVKGVVYKIGIKVVTLGHAHRHEPFTTFF